MSLVQMTAEIRNFPAEGAMGQARPSQSSQMLSHAQASHAAAPGMSRKLENSAPGNLLESAFGRCLPTGMEHLLTSCLSDKITE